jgi:hypothetical protein
MGVILYPETALAQSVTVKTAARLNLRSAPAREPNVLAVLPPGAVLEVLEDPSQEGFFKVRTADHVEGWAHGDYLLLPELPSPTEGMSPMAFAANHYPDCGGEHHYRWAAKATTSGLTGTATTTSVNDILSWSGLPFHGPTLGSWCQARASREKRVHSVRGWVRRIRKEGDGDVHIEITQTKTASVKNCIVVEIPPEALSPKFASARADLATLLGMNAITDKDFPTPTKLKFKGLAFWDGWHVSGSLPSNHGRCNSTLGAGWELHPVFKVESP